MKIIVTGASGFIGKKLCIALLERGHEVASLCRNSLANVDAQSGLYRHIPYVMGEVLPIGVEAFDPEVLVHLAWDGIPDFSENKCVQNYYSQVRFFSQTSSLSKLKKVIASGTCREYASKKGVCFESDRIQPDGYFSWAKQALSDYFRISCNERKIAFVWFRIFYVYGPGQRNESLIPTLMRSYKSQILSDIKNPNVANDYIYIDDVVKAIFNAIEIKDSCGIFNLGSGNLTTVFEIAKLVEKFIHKGTDYQVKLIQSIDDKRNRAGMFADISLAASQLVWTPQIDIAEGIRKTIKILTYE
jgi:UDP-glucose 4-epimerase